jgi:hypothetical protein
VKPVDQTAIEHFVRVTLGCRCPDEVFRSMDLERISNTDGPTVHRRLIIGNRLLIYVLDCSATESIMTRAAVAALARRGVIERDALGLNRFRLVVVSSHVEGLWNLEPPDDRAHLHVVEPVRVPPELLGRIHVPDDFNAPLSPGVLSDFEGS